MNRKREEACTAIRLCRKNMGTQFWWFYDVIAVAAVLVCIFLSARKKVLQSAVSLGGFMLAIIMAGTLSGGISEALYKGGVRQNNVSKLNKSISNVEFDDEMQKYLESLDYGLTLKYSKIEGIFNSGSDYDEQLYKYAMDSKGKKIAEKEIFCNRIHEGYAQIISKIVSDELSIYSAEYTSEQILEKPSEFEKLIPLLMDIEDKYPAAEFIADNYVKKPYKEVISLVTFTIIFFVILLISLFISGSAGKKSSYNEGIGAKVLCGFMGAVNGIILVFAIAAIIRLYVILGDDKMLFFNFEAIDNTYIFKNAYNIILGL